MCFLLSGETGKKTSWPPQPRSQARFPALLLRLKAEFIQKFMELCLCHYFERANLYSERTIRNFEHVKIDFACKQPSMLARFNVFSSQPLIRRALGLT